ERRDTNHSHGYATYQDCRTNDVRAASEFALPCVITENDEGLATWGSGISGKQGTAKTRTDTEHLEVISGDHFSMEGMPVHACVQILDSGRLRKGWLGKKILIFIPRERVFASHAIRPGEAIEGIRVPHRKRAKHVGVEQSEERQVQAE